MSLVRVLQTTQQTLTHEIRVDGVLTDATGDLNVTLARLDGTVLDGPTAAAHPSLGTYTYTIQSADTADLNSQTLDWTGTVAGGTVTFRDYVEVVGGHLFGVHEARSAPPPLDASLYPDSRLAEARIEVEQEFEEICGRAFVPRFSRRRLVGNGTLRLGVPDRLLRVLRSVTVAGVAWSAPDVAAVRLSGGGLLTRPGGAVWPADTDIVVEYEHGMDTPPAFIATAGIVRLRSILTPTSSGVPHNAISFTVQDGGVYRLSVPSRDRTGIPLVDGMLGKFPRRRRAVVA